jgi:NADH-quinone oxidoreductase subunit L
MQFVINHSYLIPLLPLLGAIIAGFFGDLYLKGKAHLPIWIGVGCSLVLSLIILFGMLWGSADNRYGQSVDFYRWISAGSFTATAGFYFDPLTAVMLTVVTGVGLVITVFAAGYMKGEEGYSRFFAYLGLFIFSMTCLVMDNNLIMMFLGWEGVGLCSYLLIGYYYWRPAAAAAAKKAFIVNRIGDFGFIVGIMLCFYAFGSVSYFGGGLAGGSGILQMAHDAFKDTRAAEAVITSQAATQLWALKYIPFCLMLGAFGKSAQFPLYVWLPDAMEGPTPVSALIHAATMVTAGIYMIARCGTLFVSNQAALTTIAVVGAFTALFAATIALRQFDLKKVFAYSTISQLGYMFVGVGVLAPTAAVFHLVTHAFFKALLFLSSGVVMHAMLGHLDLRKMSGLKRVLPLTNILMLVGCLALSGFPFTSGFFSKDEIIAQTWSHSFILGLVLLFTAFLTAYYTFRLYFQVFQGPLLQPTTPADPDHESVPPTAPIHHESHAAVDAGPTHAGPTQAAPTQAAPTQAAPTQAAPVRGESHVESHHDGQHHNPEPWIMIAPLIVLAIGAIAIGWIVVRNSQIEDFLGHSRSFGLAYDMASARFDGTGTHVVRAMFGQKELPSMRENETIIPWSMLQGAAVSVLGIFIAYVLHLKERARAEKIVAGLKPLTGLLEAKYYVDEIYDAVVVEPLRHVGKAFFAIDRVIIDSIVWAVSFVPQLSGFVLKLTMQRGYLQGYAAAMFFGVLAILLLVFL